MDPGQPHLTLTESLSALTVAQLQIIARRCGERPPTTKSALVQFIVDTFRSPGFIARQLGEADENTRLALAEAVYGDGSLDPARFRAKYGVDFQLPGHALYSSGFGYRGDATASIAELFFFGNRVPSDLFGPLRALLAAPEPFSLPTRSTLPDEILGPGQFPIPITVVETEESALHDLIATLTLVSDNGVSVSDATGQPTLAAVRALRERFLVPDLVSSMETTRAEEALRPFAFPMIVQAGGLARPHTGRLELTKAGRAALLKPAPALLKQCWEAWVAWNGLDELSRVRGIKGQKSKGQRFTRPRERKAAINRALAACPSGRWIAIGDFFRLVRLSYDFAVEAGDHTNLYIGYSTDSGWLGYSDTDPWLAVNAAYARVILLEYAATLGLIDVATIPLSEARLDFHTYAEVSAAEFSRYGGLAYFRINRLGQYLLGESTAYIGPTLVVEKSTLVVLPSLDVVVANRAELSPNDRATLERFASRVSEDVYHLSKERLLEASEGGFDPGDAEIFLRRRVGDDLPQTAAVLFSDAAAAASAVRAVGPALLIECADVHVAALISHDKELSGLCLPAGDRHLVVPESGLVAFRRGLRRLGYALPDRVLKVNASRRRVTGHVIG